MVPGTNKDIDFYYVADEAALEKPFSYDWTTVEENAIDPAPESSWFE